MALSDLIPKHTAKERRESKEEGIMPEIRINQVGGLEDELNAMRRQIKELSRRIDELETK